MAQLLLNGRPQLLNGRPRQVTGAPLLSVSVSSRTIYAAWSTSSSADTVLRCGTSPGTYNINAVDAGTQASGTFHSGIIAGLLPNTTYYGQATSGGTVVGTFTVTTLPLPASTPIIGLTIGTPAQPVLNQISSDTFYNCIHSDGLTYVTSDDTQNNWANAGPGSNMAIGKFTSESPLTGANVNFLSNYGGAATRNGPDNFSPKLSGLFSLDGNLYGTVGRQNGGGSVFTQTSGSIIKSTDHGASWSSFNTAANSNGAVPNPANLSMFDGTLNSSLFANASFVMYGADDGTLGYRVDNADAYVYLFSTDYSWDNSNILYMARVPRAKIGNLLGSDYQYYTGTGGDGALDGAWSTNPANKVAIYSNPSKVGFSAIQYIPSLNRYLLFTWYYPSGSSDYTTTTWITLEAPHPWGPWTAIDTRTYNPNGWYNPVPLVRSALTATGNGNPLTLLLSGDFTQHYGPSYKLYAASATIKV